MRKQLLKLTPKHDFFLSMFTGASHYELNKPRCQYECFNDLDSEFINYLIVINRNPEEFNKMKEDIFGLVSQEIVNRIVNGDLKPKNNIEKACFFFYLNKTCFSGKQSKGYAGLNQNRAIPKSTFHKKDIEKIKAKYRGITLPTSTKEINIERYTEPSHYKGINPKTTRPYSNNDLGLLTPIDPKAIERLRYVNLTCYDFRHVYKLFYKAFHERKKLSIECFIYEDPPFPSTEKYYGNMFKPEDHQDLINLNLDSPFHIMQSIGGDCQFYLDSYEDAGWFIKEVKTKYSTDANTQDVIIEYACMNYDITTFPKMVYDYRQKNIRSFVND